MKKTKFLSVFYLAISSLLVSVIALSVGVTLALYEKSVKGNGTYGQVSLRSYYECGSGTKDDPYVITRSRHLYNLSRLQGLGVYDTPKYFALGKKDLGGVPSNGKFMCYDDNDNLKPYLDMSSSDLDNNPINAIGSEALPFYGIFEGNFVEIKNLNVYASPEDAGLFGYTAHGSSVQNLFLTDVTIHATGYTDDYKDLYGSIPLVEVEGIQQPDPVMTAIRNVSFSYNPNNGTTVKTFNKDSSNTEYYSLYFGAPSTQTPDQFTFDSSRSGNIPTATIVSPQNNYNYTPLFSGDLIKLDNNGRIVPDTDQIMKFFYGQKNPSEGTPSYPIAATSSVSIILSSVDSDGQKHSRVLLTLEYNFKLKNATDDFIEMGVHVASDHGNNIGLIAGHCDGSVQHCYVYNGSFVMNDGGSGYNKIQMGSDLGLIGKVGSTVQNLLATESDTGAQEGKNIGVLDFTTVYSEIINSNSFTGSGSVAGLSAGVSYVPIENSKYDQYLRKYNGTYITKAANTVSFRGRSIIKNDDLGVFTLPTDALTTGMNSDAAMNLGASMISTEDNLAINNNYYVYYSTGEYNASYQSTRGHSSFKNYLDSYNNSDNSTGLTSHILTGYHIPSRTELTRASFETREARQNYFVRFKLEPNYRHGKGFYFSDLDRDTDSGAFFANYFSYKLVDKYGAHIPAGTNKCGIMLKTLKDNIRQEVSSFSASITLPQLTPDFGGNASYPYCLEDSDHNKYTSNMINFEIKDAKANITVIAAPSESEKSAALGVYSLDKSSEFVGDISQYRMQYKRSYDNPDYAFFMPSDNHLAYFDYRINTQTSKGEIGTYTSNGTFTVATSETDATVPSEYGVNEYGHTAGRKRLFAHTFCLPRGRYCIGSASLPTQCVPNVYYLCAQGQDDGQFDFDETAFSSVDTVENVDFLDSPRFNTNGEAQIVITFTEQGDLIDISEYNPSSQNNYLGNHRLYVALANSDRSYFGDSISSNLSFSYPTSGDNAGKFVVSSTLTGQDLADIMLHVAVDNYKPTITGGTNKQLTVILFGRSSTGSVIAYPFADNN